MPTCTINGSEVTVPAGTTVIQAASMVGYDIPHFCYHPALSAPASCRMCLVEIEKARKLEPACYTQVRDGMVVHTESERVKAAQRAVLEFILVNHPVDCPICDQAGECKLQDYYMDYDLQDSRLRTEKVAKVKAYPMGPEVVYDAERCIMCTRCVRFCDQITGTAELAPVERGDRAEIRTFPGQELDNAYSMCVVDLCPVGALTSREFRFQCRVWLLTSSDSICTGCSRGCSIHLDHHRNEAQRYKPRFNPEINEYWMCDEGRHTVNDLHRDRLLTPTVNGASHTWAQVARKTGELLGKTIEAHGAGSVALVLSPQASCEDLFAARRFGDSVLGGARYYVGGRPAGQGDDFLIQPDKNPNSNGLALMFPKGDRPASFETLLSDIESDEVRAVYMMGSEMPLGADAAARFVELVDHLELFVLQAPRGDDLAESAKVILPACTHAEKEGSYVNCDGIVQSVHAAYPPHGSSLADWQIFVKIAERMGAPLAESALKAIRPEMLALMETNSAPALADSSETAQVTPAAAD